MTLIAHVVLDGVTPEQYDRVRELCGWLERSPDGGLAHLTWWEAATCHSIGCWESEQAFVAFGETRLGPAMATAGVDVEPQVTFQEAHELFVPQALVRTRTPVAAVR